jgi:hypothetical protein
MNELSKYNKPGLRDAYNVLKYREDKKGGEPMCDDPKDETVRPSDEVEEQEAQVETDPDLEEDEDEDEDE